MARAGPDSRRHRGFPLVHQCGPDNLTRPRDRASRNDQEAFGALHDRHSQRVFAHCARQLGGLRDADDVNRRPLSVAAIATVSVVIVGGTAAAWVAVSRPDDAYSVYCSASVTTDPDVWK